MSGKETLLPFLGNQNWKIIKEETEKINNFLAHISTNNITELNKLTYAGVKLVYAKIDVALKNTNRNSKPEWEN